MLNINENFASPNIAFLFLGLFRRHQTPFVSSLVGDVDSGKVLLLHDGDELVVEDEDESAADASQHVGEVALEESGVSFVLKNKKFQDDNSTNVNNDLQQSSFRHKRIST